MRKPTPDQLRLRAELARAQAQIVEHLRRTVGPALSPEQAQAALEQAQAWKGPNAHQLARHLESNPSALTTPSTDCPKSLVRLLPLLVAAGHGDKVSLARCAGCGRSAPLPLAVGATGRVCHRCDARSRMAECARCGNVRTIKARRLDGAVCGYCRAKEPASLRPCAGCERLRQPSHRLPDGTHLCQTCAPKTLRQCSRCGRQRRVNAHNPDGPVCGTCYSSTPRLCGICGTIAPIMKRAADGQPDTCRRCLRRRTKECSRCGQIRSGHHIQGGGGPFHCHSCIPRSVHDCAVCGHTRPIKTFWPIGPVCNTCYRHRRANPTVCASCGRPRIIVGRTADGADLCATCCATDQPAPQCVTCGEPGDLLPDGSCPGCAIEACVSDVLSFGNGPVPAALK